MALTVPNLPKIAIKDPRIGEAFDKIQQYVNTNVTPAPGNKKSVPKFVNPQQRPG